MASNTTSAPSDALRASKPPLARNGSRYAVACRECGNWFLARTPYKLYCPYCTLTRRVEDKRRYRLRISSGKPGYCLHCGAKLEQPKFGRRLYCPDCARLRANEVQRAFYQLQHARKAKAYAASRKGG